MTLNEEEGIVARQKHDGKKREPTGWWQEQIRKGGIRMDGVSKIRLVKLLKGLVLENHELKKALAEKGGEVE